MRDAYKEFFDHFEIKFDDIIEFGEKDTIYPDPTNARLTKNDTL